MFKRNGKDHPFTDAKFESTTMCDGRKEPAGYKKCIWYMACDIGTHIDSPAHWFEGGRDISQLTLEELTAPGAVVDVTAKCEKDIDYRLTVEDLK